MIIGIDLGTTNSLVAYFDGQQAKIIPNRLGELLTPSVVSVDSDGTVYVGRTARERGGLYPLDTASVFKRSMGTDRDYLLAGRHFRAEELSSLVLRSLKEDAEAYLGQPVEEAVSSVPAYFNDMQRRATRRAGELAGLKVDRIINEPTAAAIAYGLCEQGKNGCYLVFDLGGGTLDISILELYQNIMEVHAIAGDNALGGEDFTDALATLFLNKCGLTIADVNLRDLFLLRRQAEQCKLTLSQGLMVIMTCSINGQLHTQGITRAEFEQACAPLALRIQKPVERSLKDAGLGLADIDQVVLVGGASKSPMVRSLCRRLFGRDPAAGVDPDQAIAVGAALQSAMKARDQAIKEVILTDVCPFTLGTEVSSFNGVFREEGHYAPIIDRNTVIPVSRTRRFYTAHDNQTTVSVHVLQGESRMARDNLLLGTLEIDVPPNKAGEEAVDITYTYDMNSLLEVEVQVVSTGVHKKAIIQKSDDMTEAEAQKRLEELSYLKISPRDQEENKLLLFRGERMYEQAYGELRQQIDRALSRFEGVLDSADRVAIAKARRRLEAELNEIAAQGDFLL